MRLVALKCPVCSGDIETDDLRESGICLHCGCRVLLDSADRRRSGIKTLAAGNFREGKTEEALRCADSLIKSDAADADIWYIRGMSLLCRSLYPAVRTIPGEAAFSFGNYEILSGKKPEIESEAADLFRQWADKGLRWARLKLLLCAGNGIGTGRSCEESIKLYLENAPFSTDDLSAAHNPVSMEDLNGTGLGVSGAGRIIFPGRLFGERKFIIPDSVEKIPPNAFQLQKDEVFEAVLPESVKEIGAGAFKNSSLVKINLPDSLESIGPFAFYDCLLTSVEIPPSVTVIETSAFAFCSRLETVVIPDSVKTIKKDAFRYCGKLNRAILPESAEIEKGAFDFPVKSGKPRDSPFQRKFFREHARGTENLKCKRKGRGNPVRKSFREPQGLCARREPDPWPPFPLPGP